MISMNENPQQIKTKNRKNKNKNYNNNNKKVRALSNSADNFLYDSLSIMCLLGCSIWLADVSAT